jgi:hypothetical protein
MHPRPPNPLDFSTESGDRDRIAGAQATGMAETDWWTGDGWSSAASCDDANLPGAAEASRNGAGGSANQGTSLALSADGSTAVVGGPGPNNADRDRPPSVGPAGAAWVFTRSGSGWRQQAKLVGRASQGMVHMGIQWVAAALFVTRILLSRIT